MDRRPAGLLLGCSSWADGMSSEETALLRLLALSSRAELRGLRREGVLTEGVAGMEESVSMSDLQCLAGNDLSSCSTTGRHAF